MYFIFHKIHPFKVYNSVFFLVYSQVCAAITPLCFFFFFSFTFSGVPAACRISWARDKTSDTAATYAAEP